VYIVLDTNKDVEKMETFIKKIFAEKVRPKCANCGREIKDNFIFVFPPAHFYCCIACFETDFEEADE